MDRLRLVRLLPRTSFLLPPRIPSHPLARADVPAQLAVITQGIAARSAKGQASSAKASTYAKIYPAIGALALDTIVRDMPGKL